MNSMAIKLIKHYQIEIKSTLEMMLAVSVLAEGLGLMKFWNQFVFFPFFPNILDTVILVIAGCYFLFRGLQKISKTTKL